MPVNTDAAGGTVGNGHDTAEFDRIDRILLGACAGVWLAAWAQVWRRRCPSSTWDRAWTVEGESDTRGCLYA